MTEFKRWVELIEQNLNERAVCQYYAITKFKTLHFIPTVDLSKGFIANLITYQINAARQNFVLSFTLGKVLVF